MMLQRNSKNKQIFSTNKQIFSTNKQIFSTNKQSFSTNRKTVVAVFAHPDDESFGPSGTIAKLAQDNDVYVLCATKGELGMGPSSNLAATRAQELRDSAKILGVKNVFFLGFSDGTLSNSIYHKLASKIEQKLKLIKPEILITVEPRGVSGHIDHITVSMVTSYVFSKLPFVKTLMYYCIDEKAAAKMTNYFIYFPPGYKRSEVDKIIDVTNYWPQKRKAMLAHKSQLKDARTILGRMKNLPKEEYSLLKQNNVKLYNTFSQKKEDINLKDKIGIYVCGITPDGPTHLGHAFLFVTYDALIRYLRFLGAAVTYVQNVTDIDDDMLIRSKAAGFTWKQMGEIQTKNHIKHMDNLNVIHPDFYPKATENINQMIKIIKKLVDKKLAYIKNGSVYFSVSKDKSFGKLSKYGYPAMLEIANERGNFPLDPNKNDPLDFILWQAQKPDEPFWESPWGKGRPGWHIECSAMSMRYLGKSVTIHGGGADLIFPHHEAEIAQSENYTGKKFVDLWMHIAMLYCSGKKMSKSLGNIVYVSGLLKKHSPDTIRILLLSHHYRTPWNYEEGEFEKAEETVKTLKQSIKGHTPEQRAGLNIDTSRQRPALNRFLLDFLNALDDDFNTPKAIKILKKSATGKLSAEKKLAILKASQILGLKLT